MSASVLVRLLIATSIFSLVAPTDTLGADAGYVEKGFQISPSQISLQWGTFRPFLASSNGIFALGFNEVGANGYVLTLMYTIGRNSSEPLSNHSDAPLNMEMVWNANLQSASKDDGILAINEQGNLLLRESSESAVVWATATANPGPTILFIADSGNLILSNASAVNTTNAHAFILWQSFEHPTDTLLQGQNFTANMSLTSTLRGPPEVHASVFLKMEVDGMALYANLRQNSSERMYWMLDADQESSPISPNDTLYARMDSMGFLGMFVTETKRASYETFMTYNSSEVAHRRLKLESDGNLHVYYWANTSWQIDYEAIEDFCALPSACGPYGICTINDDCMCVAGPSFASSGVIVDEKHQNVSFARVNDSDVKQGCVLSNLASVADSEDACEPGKPDKGLFVRLEGVDSLFHEFERAGTGASSNASSVEECEARCRADCGCASFFYSKGVASKCFLADDLAVQSMMQTGHVDDLAFIKLSSAKAVAMAMGLGKAAPEQQAEPSERRKKGSIAVHAIAPIVASLLVVLLAIFAVYRYPKWRRGGRVDTDRLEKKALLLAELPGLPPFVTFKELESCTSHFGAHRRAGQLGSWYEGTLRSGARVAIIKLTLTDTHQRQVHDVKLTLASVGRLAHPNLARLCCYSIDGANLALGYQIPPNGWLQLAELSWEQRVQVATGVAGALAALHDGARMVHGLLSLEAVFIAGGRDAVVGGVGVAELVAGGLAEPPYSAEAPYLTEAEDVLQYGVLLTELMTGQRIRGDLGTWRLRWRDAIGRGNPGDLLDRAIQRVAESSGDKVLLRLATVAGLCLHPSPLQRPPISTVLRIMNGSLSDLPVV